VSLLDPAALLDSVALLGTPPSREAARTAFAIAIFKKVDLPALDRTPINLLM
jgi:hypothetical protein